MDRFLLDFLRQFIALHNVFFNRVKAFCAEYVLDAAGIFGGHLRIYAR